MGVQRMKRRRGRSIFETAPTSSFTRPSLPSIANGTPAFDAAFYQSPEFVHGFGGNPFSDVDVSTYFTKPHPYRQSAVSGRCICRSDHHDVRRRKWIVGNVARRKRWEFYDRAAASPPGNSWPPFRGAAMPGSIASKSPSRTAGTSKVAEMARISMVTRPE